MEDPNFIFSSGKVELKQEGEDFFVEGYISTSDLDLVNDIVTKACIMDMAEQMRSRTIKLDIEHESFRGKSQIETEINKTIIPAAKIEDFLIDKKGLKVRAMLNRHIQRFEEIKNSIRDGFLDAFSIAFVPVKETTQNKGGKPVRMLDKVNLLNVAFTGNPVNTHATIENVFMKSLSYLGEKAKAPKRPKPKVPESEYEDEEEEDEEEEEKKKEGPGGHKPNKTGPHGRGSGPGQGRADGSGMDDNKKKKEEKNNHLSNDIIKLQEVKKMEEDNKETTENPKESEEESETETKDESENESEESVKEEINKDDAEVKALTAKVDGLTKELAEVKSLLKVPVRKSKVEIQDKSKDFVETETKDPLDLI